MGSIYQRAKKLSAHMSMSKKGVLGLETASEAFKAVLVLAVVAIAMFLVLSTLNDAGLFATGSRSANDTNNLINNVTAGVTNDFFASIGSVFSILIAVVIILVVVLIFVGIRRIGGSEGAGGL